MSLPFSSDLTTDLTTRLDSIDAQISALQTEKAGLEELAGTQHPLFRRLHE